MCYCSTTSHINYLILFILCIMRLNVGLNSKMALVMTLGKVPFINIKLKSLVKGSSNNGIPYLIISFETESNACTSTSHLS
jgi:hypothetical protein